MDRKEKQARALEDVAQTHLLSVSIETKLAHAVVRARVSGASWQQVGDALGLSKATAARRYGQVAEELHPNYTYPLDSVSTDAE